MILIMGITIITFVIFFSPTARISGPSSGGNFGSIDGQRITKEDYLNARNEVYLRYFFQHGSWPRGDTAATGFDAQRETYQWLFFIQKLREYDIHVDSDSVARAANGILTSFGRGKTIPLAEFTQRVLAPQHFTVDDFERYLQHELGIQQLAEVVGLSGELVTPAEARSYYERENQEIATEAAFFSASNYLAGVAAPSAKTVAEYYTNQMANYRLPDRVQVDYVEFGITNYFNQAEQELTNLTELVETNYQRIGTNWTEFGKTPAEAKINIRKRLIHHQAVLAATRRANAFADVLFDMEPGQLAALARTNKLTVRVTKPFDEEYGPTEFDGGPNFAKTAFSLTTNDPYGGPLVGADDVYIIALDRQIPSEVPPLSQIHGQVASDYRYSQAMELARRAGEQFHQMATNGLARGKSFSEICAQAKVKAVVVPPFSLSSSELPSVEDHISLRHYKEIALTTLPGKVSPLLPTRQGGVVVCVEKRLPIDVAKMEAALPDYMKSLRRMRQAEAFNAWFGREASQSLVNTPLGQPRQTPSSGGAPASQ